MGIPKLLQDLLPYAEGVVLGCPTEGQSILTLPFIQKVVVDGPSLVYYVYSRLYPRCDSSEAGVEAQPSYTEICLGVAEFLTTLLSRQIDIKAIYFDGALPSGKQVERLRRLEKSRSLLENYRKQRPGPFKPPNSAKSPASALGSEFSIWKKKFPASGRSQQLPPPPFMVACVLDELRNDFGNDYSVQVVPGEADSYCASTSRFTGAAILSNDSDMAMYDLGSEGSLILFDTLELATLSDIQHDGKHKSHILLAQRLHPLNIARRLSLTVSGGGLSLLRFGFERANYPSESAGWIRSQCTTVHSTKTSEEFKRFCELYMDPRKTGTVKDIINPFIQLDPRLSELHFQYHCVDYMAQSLHDPHIYMPLMVEDPTRDSSWTYGKGLRILAYSLLGRSAERKGDFQNHKGIIEFQKRGPRIAGVPFKLLNRAELLSSMQTLVRDLGNIAFADNAVLPWRLFALGEVNAEKARNGKSTIPLAWASEFLGRGYVEDELPWEDIHIYANIQAVLYSIWILKQSCNVAKPEIELQKSLEQLSQALRSLISLRSLMASRWEIASSSEDIPRAVMTEVLVAADPEDTRSKKNSIGKVTASGSDVGSNHATFKPTFHDQNRRRRANANIFEVLKSS